MVYLKVLLFITVLAFSKMYSDFYNFKFKNYQETESKISINQKKYKTNFHFVCIVVQAVKKVNHINNVMAMKLV